MFTLGAVHIYRMCTVTSFASSIFAYPFERKSAPFPLYLEVSTSPYTFKEGVTPPPPPLFLRGYSSYTVFLNVDFPPLHLKWVQPPPYPTLVLFSPSPSVCHLSPLCCIIVLSGSIVGTLLSHERAREPGIDHPRCHCVASYKAKLPPRERQHPTRETCTN